MVRDFYPGIGQAVAARTILRTKEDGSLETWGDVAHRVAVGNCSLHSSGSEDLADLERLIAKGAILLSGRHLQHGDENQKDSSIERFSNCSTACTSFFMFYLLMNGSGVGRSYDDDIMLCNWDYAPTVRTVLSESHPDFNYSAHESVAQAQHKYAGNPDTFWFKVPDTREGWAQALEVWETAAYEKVHANKILILDFSDVRPKGSPIQGMQNRPASGPIPLLNAFNKANTIKGAGLPRWKQALYIDHYFAECVLVGGARRSARMSTKYWGDEDILDFIKVKTPIGSSSTFLWSSNNSVMVDKEFWDKLAAKDPNVETIFNAIAKNSYEYGEPGIINVDKLKQDNTGLKDYLKLGGQWAGSGKYQVRDESETLLKALCRRALKKKYNMIVNPCTSGDTLILTKQFGYMPINKLVGIEVEVWNGLEWSWVTPNITGIDRELFRVQLDNGSYLDCTANHNWKLTSGFKGRHKILDKSTNELVAGDILQPFSMPVLKTGYEMLYPYTHGFFCGDGYLDNKDNKNYIWLYGTKMDVLPHLDTTRISKKTPGHSRLLIQIPDMEEKFFVPINANLDSKLKWLAGLLDSDGCVVNYGPNSTGYQIASINKTFLRDLQLLLTTLGVRTKIGTMKSEGFNSLPDGCGGYKDYFCQESYRLCISAVDALSLCELGLETHRLPKVTSVPQRDARRYVRVVSVESIGIQDYVYCFTEPKNHTGTFNGIVTGQCGEIAINLLGGYCVIADVVPYHADSIEEALRAFELTTRALMRVNLMDSLYSNEVKRTNRIGVGITGIHEFMWKEFKLSFKDVSVPEKSWKFWYTMEAFGCMVERTAREYAEELGVNIPHTMTTVKPAGTTSKLFGLTEGWHLPSMARYIRWVQFANSDPLIQQYKELGYPVKELRDYENTSIVGFPTKLAITDLIPEGELVCAGEASIESQYDWIRLGEECWLGESFGNQISYTLKYDPEKVSLEEFRSLIQKHQKRVKCCSVMPQRSTESYEYLPEQAVTKAEFEAVAAMIKSTIEEDVDRAHVDCAGGACPINFNKE